VLELEQLVKVIVEALQLKLVLVEEEQVQLEQITPVPRSEVLVVLALTG
jgi:hypothetical protein